MGTPTTVFPPCGAFFQLLLSRFSTYLKPAMETPEQCEQSI